MKKSFFEFIAFFKKDEEFGQLAQIVSGDVHFPHNEIAGNMHMYLNKSAKYSAYKEEELELYRRYIDAIK